MQVYKSRLATISAIKGACPAGGCALSICCDERLMTEKGHIGLNEVALGIAVPKYWAQLLVNIVGYPKAQQMCLNASLLSPQQALSHGLVNQVIPLPNNRALLKSFQNPTWHIHFTMYDLQDTPVHMPVQIVDRLSILAPFHIYDCSKLSIASGSKHATQSFYLMVLLHRIVLPLPMSSVRIQAIAPRPCMP